MMEYQKEEIRISFTSDRGGIQKEQIYAILSILDNTTLPKPKKIMWTNQKLEWEEKEIDSFTDKLLFERIDPLERDREVYETWVDYNSETNLNIRIGQSYEDVINIYVVLDVAIAYAYRYYGELFSSMLQLIPYCKTGKCGSIYDKIYKSKFKELAKPYLGWLQYFNGKMIVERGGFELFESNSLLKTERIHNGLLIQVGESPYDAFTPEGEKLLVEATRSLPPVKNIG